MFRQPPSTPRLAIRGGMPDLAEDLTEPLTKIANGMFLVLVILILVKALPLVLSFGVLPITTIAVMTIASLAIGHCLGGPALDTQAALAIANATRNADLALLVATLNFADETVLTALVSYALVSAAVAAVYINRYKRILAQAEVAEITE